MADDIDTPAADEPTDDATSTTDDTEEPVELVLAPVLTEIEMSAGDVTVTVKAPAPLEDVCAAARILFQDAHPHRRQSNPIGFGSTASDTERDPDRPGYRGPLENWEEEPDDEEATHRMDRRIRNQPAQRAAAQLA